jgi:hypothetical protein
MKPHLNLIRRTAHLALAVLAIAAAASVSAQTASITLVSPDPGATGVFPKPTVLVELTDGTTTVDTNTITMSFDGGSVTPTITQTGLVTYVSYTVPSTLVALSAHTVNFGALDSAATPIPTNWSFTVSTYTTVPSGWAYPAGSGDAAQPGFAGRIHQLRLSATQSSAITTAEAQLAGLLIESSTGLAFTNMVVTNGDPNIIALSWAGTKPTIPGPNPAEANAFTASNTINYSILGGAVADAGDFTTANGYPDALFPGTPGYDDYTFSTLNNSEELAVEVLGWIELPAGPQRIGVNCNDGFQLAISPNDARDIFRTSLAQNEGNRGPVDSTVTLNVQASGVYSFRLLFRSYRSTEPNQLEWFRYDGSRTNLINDTVVGAVKSYQTVTVPTRTYVKSVSPAPGASGVAPTDPISVVLVNATNSPAPVLKVKGTAVTYTSVTNGNTVTLTYTPAAPLSGIVTNEVTYAGAVGTWAFQTRTGHRALYIVTSGGVPNTSDSFVGSRLASKFGLDVEYADAATVGGNGGNNLYYATNRALILFSSIISSGSLPNWLRNLVTNNSTVPIIGWESGNADELGVCATVTAAAAGTTDLLISNSPHPLTAGFPNGITNVYPSGSADGQKFINPFPEVIVTATDPVDPTIIRIAGLTNGTVLNNYVNAAITVTNASRKVFLGLLGNTQANNLTTNGLALLDAAITWALQPQPVLTVTRGPGAGQATLSWTFTGTLETTTSLTPPISWGDAPSQANPQTVNVTDLKRFYRVRQP